MSNEVAPDSWLNSPILRRGLYASGRERVALHVVFWISLSCFSGYSNTWVLKEANWQVYLSVVLANIVVVSVSYYFLLSFGIPKLYANKWLQFVLCLFVVYLFNSYANYFLYNWLFNTFHILERFVVAFGRDRFWYAPFQEYSLLINWSFTLSSLVIPVVVKVLKDILMARTKTAELERDNLRLELQFLQGQIQPHFVLNSINSVYSVVAGIDDEAATMLLRLSELLRYALHETASPTVSLSREVEFLSEYIGLEAVRQHERTTLSFQHDGLLEGFDIPPLLLVTFIENAFKHGINATYRQAWADVRLHITENGILNFHVANSKPPAEVRKSARKQMPGIGLENTQRRLSLLFPNKHLLTVNNDTDTFTVDLTLHLTRRPTVYTTQPNLTRLVDGATYL